MGTSDTLGHRRFRTQTAWDIEQLFGKSGVSKLRGYVEGNDGRYELICSVGAQAHFARIDQDQNILWQSVQDTGKNKTAYNPQITDGALFYGSKATNTIYAVELSDGSLRWSTSAPGIQSLEQTDIGLAYGTSGASTEIGVLDYADGTQLSGWPITYDKEVSQRICAGDLDGDGADEIAYNNDSGHWAVRNGDGSLVFEYSHDHSHIDLYTIADIDGDGTTELLTVVDTDASVGADEGDEISLYTADGTRKASYDAGGGGIAYALWPTSDGYDIYFGEEGAGRIGKLDGSLSEQWTLDLGYGSTSTGQIFTADWDGDGQAEVFVNQGEGPASGFVVYDADGEWVTQTEGVGWDIHLRPTIKNGDPEAKRFVDLDGDGRDEIDPSAISSNDQNNPHTIRLMERLV